MSEPDNRAEEQAKRQLKSILAMVKALRKAEKNDNEDAIEKARQAIEEDPLSVETRSGWRSPGTSDEEDVEYCILLSTGGPASRIYGELGECNEPSTAAIQYQDWGTPWTTLRPLSENEEKALLEYARCFYWGY